MGEMTKQWRNTHDERLGSIPSKTLSKTLSLS